MASPASVSDIAATPTVSPEEKTEVVLLADLSKEQLLSILSAKVKNQCVAQPRCWNGMLHPMWNTTYNSGPYCSVACAKTAKPPCPRKALRIATYDYENAPF